MKINFGENIFTKINFGEYILTKKDLEFRNNYLKCSFNKEKLKSNNNVNYQCSDKSCINTPDHFLLEEDYQIKKKKCIVETSSVFIGKSKIKNATIDIDIDNIDDDISKNNAKHGIKTVNKTPELEYIKYSSYINIIFFFSIIFIFNIFKLKF